VSRSSTSRPSRCARNNCRCLAPPLSLRSHSTAAKVYWRHLRRWVSLEVCVLRLRRQTLIHVGYGGEVSSVAMDHSPFSLSPVQGRWICSSAAKPPSSRISHHLRLFPLRLPEAVVLRLVFVTVVFVTPAGLPNLPLPEFGGADDRPLLGFLGVAAILAIASSAAAAAIAAILALRRSGCCGRA